MTEPVVQMTDPVVLEDKVTTHWWVAAPHDRFVYEVYVVRYHEKSKIGYWAPWQEYLDPDLGWQAVPEGATCRPILELDQRMVHAIVEAGIPLDRSDIATSLTELCRQIEKGVQAESVEPEPE
jgi:hypothetical protein